jgi:hypothetical protein
MININYCARSPVKKAILEGETKIKKKKRREGRTIATGARNCSQEFGLQISLRKP